tara:strand:+ start:6361 stop:6768 length:408 start_codon:yes stop_codon:yes gene_type:complete
MVGSPAADDAIVIVVTVNPFATDMANATTVAGVDFTAECVVARSYSSARELGRQVLLVGVPEDTRLSPPHLLELAPGHVIAALVERHRVEEILESLHASRITCVRICGRRSDARSMRAVATTPPVPGRARLGDPS